MKPLGTLSVDAPAKINLGLRILSRRSDGYHEIETGLVLIDWCDRITVGLADSVSITCSDRRLPTNGDNLCVRVAVEIKREFNVSSGIHFHLEKQIPFGAGLGGGSSDAAAAIKLLSEIWSLNLSETEQYDVAKRIGSDVPFFLRGTPSIGRGRGEKLTALELPSVLSSLWVGVVDPGIVVSTAQAYSEVTARNSTAPSLEGIISQDDIGKWKSDLINDFEISVFESYPALASIKNRLYRDGGIFASLTGSGSAIFSLFETKQGVVKAMKNTGLRSWVGRFRL